MNTFWVVEGSYTSVDLDELAEAAWKGSATLELVQNLRDQVKSQFNSADSTLASPSSLYPEAALAKFQYALEFYGRFDSVGKQFENDLADYVDCLRVTGMIYATAESDVASVMKFSQIPLGSEQSHLLADTCGASLLMCTADAWNAARTGKGTSLEGLVMDALVADLANDWGLSVKQITRFFSDVWKVITALWLGIRSWHEVVLVKGADGYTYVAISDIDDSGNLLFEMVPLLDESGQLVDDALSVSNVDSSLFAQIIQDLSSAELQARALQTFTADSGVYEATPTETPLSIADALGRINNLRSSAESGQLEILHHQTEVDGQIVDSWSVIIRGTVLWGPGTSHPQDLESNLQEVAGEVSAQRTAIVAAMEQAGIQPGDPVELIGHSQGGIMAVALAADTSITGRYNIKNVVTAGSPVATISNDSEIPMVHIQNLADVVPALDGGVAASDSQVTVYFDGSQINVGKTAGAHSLDLYVEAARQLEQDQVVPGFTQNRQSELYLTDDTKSESLVFDTLRVRQAKSSGNSDEGDREANAKDSTGEE